MAATVMFAGQVAAIFVRPHSGALAYEVALRGNTAVFHGRMNAAAASELELLLNDKTVKRLAITDSSGGQAAPALTLAKIIHTRRLFVVALGACDPACVFLLSAGSVRAVVPQTVFEFGSGIDRNLYLRAGLAGTPFDALHASSAGAAYKPSLRTLIGNGFVTSIFVVANRRYMRATTWCAKNPVACMRPAGQNAGPPETRGGG
jgi:hypothetical protein